MDSHKQWIQNRACIARITRTNVKILTKVKQDKQMATQYREQSGQYVLKNPTFVHDVVCREGNEPPQWDKIKNRRIWLSSLIGEQRPQVMVTF